MGWQLLATAQIFFSSFDALLQRKLAKVDNVSAHTKSTFAHVGVLTIGACYAAFTGGVSLNFDNIAYVYAISSALLIALGSIAIFIAAESLDAANLNIIIMLRAVGVTIVASVLLGETLSPYQLLGATLIMLAGFIASHPDRGEKVRKSRGVSMALLGVAFFSVGLVLEKATIDEMGLSTYVLIGWGLQLFFVTFLSMKRIRNDGIRNIKILAPKMMMLGIMTGLGGLTYVAALSLSDNTPLVVSFLNLKVLLVILGGYIFLREKKGMHHKIIGGILALGGVMLLVL